MASTQGYYKFRAINTVDWLYHTFRQTLYGHVKLPMVQQDLQQDLFHPLGEQRGEQGEHGESRCLRSLTDTTKDVSSDLTLRLRETLSWSTFSNLPLRAEDQ